jgi:exodeoxyribonuclease VIII
MPTWVQIDLETFGLKSNCPVISLGAVVYTYGQGIYGSFHRYFDLDEQFRNGRIPQSDTIRWWLNQGESARQSISRNQTFSVDDVTDEFYEWWREDVDDPIQDWAEDDDPELGAHVMSNGPAFDISILDSLFTEVPWHYRNVRCFRSMVDWFGSVKINDDQLPPALSIRHDALSDAYRQALIHLELMKTYEQLR